MLKNYFKIAFRNLWRNPLFSFINVFGLALSMAVGVVLLNDVKRTFDYDTFHPEPERLIRIVSAANHETGRSEWATVPQPLTQLLREAAPIEQLVSFRMLSRAFHVMVENGEIPVKVAFTEPAFFDLFGFRLLSGNGREALGSPGSVLLREDKASALFGDSNPLGKVITLDSLGRFTVAGIVENSSYPSHIQFEAILSSTTARALERAGKIPDLSQNWKEHFSVAAYALLKPGMAAAKMKHLLSSVSKELNSRNELQDIDYAFRGQAVTDITPWNPGIRNDYNAGANWKGIWMKIFLVAALTLLAAFNYVSLTLARSLKRAREIGIRKATGALRKQIFFQFLTESVLVAAFSLGLAFIFITFIKSSGPWDKGTAVLSLQYEHWKLWIWLLPYMLLTGLVAGCLPAWLLSSFEPIKALQSLQNVRLLGRAGIYRGLIVVQFAVSVMLMVFLVILRDAVRSEGNINYGYSTDNLVIVENRGEDLETLKLRLSQVSHVEGITSVQNLPPYGFSGNDCVISKNRKEEAIGAKYLAMDQKAPEVLEMKLIAGTGFPPNLSSSNEQYVLVNVAGAKFASAGTVADAVGETIWIDDSVQVQIAGVLAGFTHLMPGIAASQPILIRYQPESFTLIAVKVREGGETAVIKAARDIWEKNIPHKVPRVYAETDMYDQQQKKDQLLQFFGFWTGLVILIACLGLYGMAAYTVEIRTKELGIRRTLGATGSQLLWQLSKNFGKLLLWAGLIGLPAGWFCGSLLRDRMTETLDLGPVNLLIGYTLVLLTGSLTLFAQTWLIKKIEPSEVLRKG